MNDNIQKLYGALQKYGYNDLGTAEEFGAKVQDDSSRRKLYDAMSRDGFDDLGTYEEFSGKLMQDAKPQPVQATEPVKSESQKRTDRFNAMVRRHEEANGHVPGEEDEATEAWAKEFVASRGLAGYERRKQERHDELSQMVEDRKANEAAQKVEAREQKAFEAAEGAELFNEMRRKKGETTVAERAAELTKGQTEPLGANVEGKTAEELDQIKHSMGLEQSFTKEYEKRRAEYAEHMKEYASVRGDARNVDFSKYEEEREWLKKNEAKYNDMKGRLDNVQSKFLELTTPDAMSDLDEAQKANRDQMASPSEVMASGYTPFGGSNIGSSEEAKENAIRTKADEIYNMARQTLNQGSKYDKGYEGSGMEQAATAIRQFIQGGINNVDKGSLTMGLSEGMALMEARKVGDKYNGIITDTIKDLGYSDRDVTRMMGDLEKKTKELEPVAQELERSRAEIEVMQSTLDEMIANGADESKIRTYAKELNNQINSYNKKIKDSESLFADYKKTRDQYDEVTSAVEAAIQNGLTGGEQAILDAVQQYTKAQYLRSNDVSKAAAAGAGLEDTLEFMLGFILTGGLEKAGTKAATKLTMRHLEKKLGKEGVKELAAKAPIKASLGYKALTDVGVAAARTLALPTRNIQTYGEQIAEYADVDKLGRLQFNRSKVNALANTAYQNFVENWSEGFGTYLSAGEQKLFRLATGNAPKVAIGKTLQNYRGSIGNYLDHGKFDGLFNEMMEEVGGSGLNWFAGWLSSKVDPEGAGIGDKEALSQFFAGEQLATTFLSFLPLSAIGAATNISAYNKMARRYDESVAKLNPLIESGALDAEKLDKITSEISGMTPERAAKRIIELGKETRENNHGELPEDFAPAVMGYIQGKYAMDLRHDEWEDSREKMAVVQAYASAYERPDLRNAWDSRQAEQETRAAAVEAGFTDEELDRNAYVLAQDAASIRETDPERSQVLSNYANAKSARAGLVDSYSEAGRKAEEEFDAAVRQNLSRDGIVISAQVQENGQPKTVYITTKGVKINNDGTVSTPTGVDGPILYRDSATGEQKKVMASQLSGAEIFETDNFIREANEADADVRARAFEAAENTVSMTGRVRAISANIGNNVVVRRNGVYAPVKIERMTNGGLGVVISGDKKALQGIAAAMGMQVPASQYLEAPVAQFYNLLSKEQDGSLTTFNEEQGQAPAQAQGAQGAPAQAAEEVPEVEIKPNDKFTVNYKGQPREVDIDQANDTEVWFSYTDENGNEATGVMTPYDFRESIVTEGAPVQEAAPAAAQAPAPAPAQAQAAFPVDENGNRIYDDPSVSPQAAYDEIYNGVEAGSRNEANRNKFVAAKAAKAAKDVEDARNRIAGLQARKDAVDQWELPDNEELDAFENRKAEEKKKFDDEIAQIEAGLPELERKAAHWNGVQTLASQRTAPAPAQAAPAPAPAAQKRKPKMSRRARIARAKQWEERTGVKVKIAMTPKQVTDKDARESLENGEIVYGWYDNDTHTVGLYLPYLTDEEEVDKTFIHEVISHRGLRALLGDEEYNKLLDRVWNELMSEQEQKDWLAYNEHLKGHSEEFLRRAAADEFIANLSEDLDVADHRTAFEKFVDWVKDLFNRVVPRTSEQIAAEAAGIAAKESISRDDLFTLLRDSLSNYEAVLREEKKRAEAEPMTTESLPKDIQDGLKEQGKVMEGGTVMDEQQAALKEATGYKTPNEKDMASNSVVGDVRMSKETMPAWKRNYMTYPEAKEHVVKVLENLMERMSADQLVNNVVPGGVYKYGEKTSGSKAGPLRTNIEYIVTFDMDTSCPRSLQYLEYVKKIEAQIGRPLTQTEMIQLIEMMRVYGQMIPCVYCYCENKRQALKQYYHDFMTARQGVINAKTEEEALAAMYGHETTKAARESKDPKVALTEAAYKVFTRWRSGEIKYNPSLKQLWSQYRNDRNVILTVLDQLLDNKKITTFMTDETIAGHLCKELRIEDKLAKKAAEDLVGEWKWNRIENRPHNDFTRIEDEDDLVVGQETLALWREMTAYGKSASQAKNVLRYVPYTDELKTLSQKDRDYINGMGGLRMHSSNDFRIDYVLDYFQFMADMAVNHMYGHTYTKSPEFVRIFGNSGYKINMSIAAVEDANGIHPNSQEGFDWDEARELREKFPNAGVMLMATSDAQVQMALDSDWIDMFIPFHASGLPKAVWYDMRQWTDYSSIQNERFLNGDEMRAALAEDGVVIPKGTSAEEVEQMYIDHFNIHVERYKTGKKAGKRISPHFLPGKTIVDGVEIPGHNNDYETYIRLCREWGVHPRFYGLKVKDNTPEGGGREVDITEHPAYMKCIKETARTDTPQTAIEFNFDQPSEAPGGKTPIDYAFEELQNRAAAEAQSAGAPVRNIYESYKQDPYGIVPQFINTIIKHKETTGKDYPLDYLTPDSRKWAMEERKALEAAYKEFDTIPYHPHEYDEDGNLIMEPSKDTAPVVANEGGESGTMLRKRVKPAPQNTKTGYAAFAVLQGGDGKYYLQPKMVQVEGQGTPVRTWLDADTGEIRRDKDGNMITNTKGRIKVQDSSINKRGGSSRGQGLAWRPGKHLAEYPNATQFAVENPKTGVKDVMQDNIVFFEVSYAADKDYQTEAWEYGFNDKGKYNHSQAGLPYIPVDGYYKYRTNVNPDIPAMIITGAFKIERALTDAEAKELNQKAGGTWLERESGKPVDEARLRELGFAKDQLEERRDEYDFSAIEEGRDESAEVMKLEGYTPHAIDFDNENLKAAAKENGQDLDSYREGYQTPEERGWDRSAYTGESGTRFRKANQAQLGLVSNAGAALDRIKMDKATPEQWVKMLEKEGGLKAGEDKWIGLSDWLKSQDKKSITKDEIDDYIAEHRIVLAEAAYTDEDPDQLMSRKDPEAAEAFEYTESSWDERAIADIKDTAKAVELYNRDNPDDQVTAGPNGEMTPEDRDKILEYAEDRYLANADVNRINSVRLGYTTNGLDNKREIALVVPTIESWNENDTIHFGDAGNGRAVAWVRFGETTAPAEGETDANKDHAEAIDSVDAFEDRMKEKYGEDWYNKISAEERDEERRLLNSLDDAFERAVAQEKYGKRVLVIDEIQSKRHQEGREHGYRDDKAIESATKKVESAQKEYDDYIDSLKEKYGGYNGMAGNLTEEENKRAEDLNDAVIAAQNEAAKSEGGVPAAPFEKNWHELAMKRMLRLAAEEGYDYVAWTTGNQQAERYNIGGKVDWIQRGNDFGQFPESVFIKMGDKVNSVEVDENGTIVDSTSALSDTVGKPLSDLLGKELAEKVMSATPGKEGRMDGEDLRVGGEGMKGFYDDILPRFMNKYGKKWGVKVQDITLPNVEEAGRVMHAVPVTQEMKDSVMEGQTMFRKALDPETAELFDAAKERFGTTRDLREAGYILPDGTMLDFSGRHWTDPNSDNSWLNGRREVDHRDISDIEYERDGNTPTGLKTDMSDFIRRGAIRINYPGSINLATKPTWDQVDALERLIRMDNRFVRVDFGDGSRSDHYADYDYASPAKIIDDIYGYFDDGVKPQGTSGTFFRKATIEEQRIADAGREATVQAFGTMPAVIKSGVNGISRGRMPDGHKTDKGYYDPGDNNVYVCMDNVADERDAVATVVHETVGYKGLQELLGDRFNDMMTGVYAALDNAGRAWVNAYIARNGLRPGDAAVVRGMEEYLARTAERDGGDSLENVNEVLSKIVGDLFGVADFEFSDRELAYILRASYEHSVNPGWLDTPVGRAKDTLMKRELGINETDPNKPTDPDGGTRFRKEVGDKASQQYTQDMDYWLNKMLIENQNADLPVKIGMQRAMQEVFGDNWEEKMRELPESQDYLMRHNEASSRADTEAHNFMLFHYEPMIEQVKEIRGLIAGRRAGIKAKREAYQRVLDYMYAVSGLERNEWERANGGEQKDWSGITSLMGYKDKDQWQEAEADAREMIDQFRTQLRDAVRKDGQTDAEAQADADAMLNELWNLVQSCTDFSLDHAYKYGLLTRDEYERLRGTASKPRMWDHYLPLRGFSENTAEDVFGYATLSGNGGGEVVEHAKGRWTEADNPLANILNIAQREIVHGNENWARQALLNFTVNLGKNSLLSERNPWYVKVPGTKKWQLAYPEPIVDPATNEQTGTESIEDFEARMQELKANGEARQGRKGLKIDQIMTNKGHRNQHLIHVKIGGSDRMIWVNGDPSMARAVSGYGKKTSWKLFRGASRVLSNLFTTYSLDFTAKNLIRDSVYSRVALLMKEDQNYRWHFLKNWWNNFGYGAFAFPMVRLAAEWDSGKLQQKQNLSDRERMFIEFMHDGGQTGYTVVRSVEKLKKDLEKTMAPRLPKRIVDWAKVDIRGVEVPILGIFSWGVRTLNEAFELLTRFTTYQTSREMGRTGQRAAYDAKEISVNFNRKGAQSDEGFWGQLAAFLGGTHYFYNAGVQGFDNFLRLYKTAPVKMGATSAAIMGMGLIMPFINSMLAGIGSGGDDGGDDEWYWNLPEWVRRNNIIIGWKSTKKDEDGKKRVVGASYFALPLPVEFRAIYGLGDITAAAFAYQKMPNRTFGRVAGDVLSTTAAILPFNPIENYTAGGNVADAAIRAVAPDILMPFVDVATNRDYTGRALMKENPFTHVVPKNQGAYASTPKALVDACQWIGETTGLDLAPGVVRDVLSNYAGGYYRFAEDIAKQMFTDVDHPRRWDDIPFLSGFTGHIDEDRTNTYVNGVLNEYKRLSQKTVLKMNLFNSSDDITEKIAYETPELLPDKAKIQRILSGKNYELGKMYYEGMKDKGTGEYHKVEKVHKSGKSAGKRYSVKEEIKIPGVETLKKRWKDAREYWASLPKGSPEAAEAYKDVTNAWHEYYNAQANLAEKLMNYEYGK